MPMVPIPRLFCPVWYYDALTVGVGPCRRLLFPDYSVQFGTMTPLRLELAHADGSYSQMLAKLARTQLLIFDDWLRGPLSRSQSRDLLEILDDRYGRSATMVVTQVPVTDWHARLPDPTLSDAILDRLIHNAYRLELQGESMRKVHSPLSNDHS